jgi:hypothetical protein
MNINLLIELKKEYTELLLEILTPHIYDGFLYLYKKAKDCSTNEKVLKTFQKLLKQIPKWDENILKKEYERIINNTRDKYPWLVDLVKAVIKSNIKILTTKNIPANVYNDINILNFIHTIYIESARRI